MQNILVINLMYIGDLLFATPALRSLRIAFPEAKITLLADKKNAAVVRHNRHISEIIEIDKKGYHAKLPHFIELIQELRQKKFDLVINLHRNERSSALAAFSGGKKIIGFSKPGFHFFFDQVIEERTDIHQVDAYLEVLKSVGIPLANEGLEMEVDEASKEKAEALWYEVFPEDLPHFSVVGLNTGGSWPTKRWSKEGFAVLADSLLESGYGVAFFGGPMDLADVTAILALMQHANSKRLAIFTGKTTLLEMAALVQRCRVLVTGDSGPMHIAVSQKVPVIALFGPSDPIRYAPYHQQDAVIVSARDCLACGQHSCSGHECMKEIEAKTILAKVEQRLERHDKRESRQK
ncbi:MAG: glycosyltransferase family 9 protein [Sporomusaceae bacterium]|nr:glycosyltransferase family 9 protein [Sporomusaceae bacterium]